MSLQAFLLSVAVGAAIMPTPANAASSLCADPGAVCNVQCYDAYCTLFGAHAGLRKPGSGCVIRGILVARRGTADSP
jgi:hypothetical protein